MTTLTGAVNLDSVIPNTTGHGFPISSFWSAIKKGWRTALFMEALRNLAWSRGYLWYAELDGVPNPFQRGGVLGLPCKSISINPLVEGESLDIPSSTITMRVPKGCGSLGTIQLSLLDDEQGTLYSFFERWYNEVYNPYYGVLPVTEACKQLSLYRQKASRRNVKRVYYDIDNTVNNVLNTILPKGYENMAKMPKSTDAYEFLVYPSQNMSFNWQTDANDLMTLEVNLQIAYFINQDFGNPCVNNGQKTIFDVAIGTITDGASWLDKIADYI